MTIIVSSENPVTLLGAGPVSAADLDRALALAPTLVAADGGAETALGAGHAPSAVIGDMDSLSPGVADRLGDRLHPISEQQTTDFDKALRSIDAPLVLGLGFTGGRLDHTLAAMSTLAAHPHRPCLLLGAGQVACLCPPRVSVDLARGSLLSLFPLAEVRASGTGLEWPLDGLALSPLGRIGTSNRVTGPVRLSVDRPALLLILDDRALPALVSSLAGRPDRPGGTWPVPA